MPCFLNIACGSTYVTGPEWENVDYSARDQHVRRQDILGGLETSAPDYEVVYCSHFLEHVPHDLVPGFLSRCRQLTRGDGLLRLVVPDAEMLLREYLAQRSAGEDAKADYAFVVFLDQCVRRRPGGRLGEFDRRIGNGELAGLRSYAEFLLGPESRPEPAGQGGTSLARKLARLLARPDLLLQRLEPAYIRAVCALLPRAFREQNVSFTGIGERHQWMWDFSSLGAALREAGYTRIERASFDRSSRGDRLFAPLDEVLGAPRKGHHQLFVEARP